MHNQEDMERQDMDGKLTPTSASMNRKKSMPWIAYELLLSDSQLLQLRAGQEQHTSWCTCLSVASRPLFWRAVVMEGVHTVKSALTGHRGRRQAPGFP